MGELRVIGSSLASSDENVASEDLALTWRQDNAEETALAAKTFTEWVTKGWLAIGETAGNKEQIFTFDPALEKITLIPIIEGG